MRAVLKLEAKKEREIEIEKNRLRAHTLSVNLCGLQPDHEISKVPKAVLNCIPSQCPDLDNQHPLQSGQDAANV